MPSSKQLLKTAEALRAKEHRRKASLRLKTLDDVYEFIHERQIVSFFGGNELPSLISAILGRQWKPSKKGFAGWNDWWDLKISGKPIPRVSREIESRPDILVNRMFRHTKTLISEKLWPVLSPIVKQQTALLREGRILSKLERRILETVSAEKTIRTDRLREKLKLEGKENNSQYHRALANLETYSLIIGAEDPNPETHLHANVWQTWDTRTGSKTLKPNLSLEDAAFCLYYNTIDASVLAMENQIGKWFPWNIDAKKITERLLREGSVLRSGPCLITSRVHEVNSQQLDSERIGTLSSGSQGRLSNDWTHIASDR